MKHYQPIIGLEIHLQAKTNTKMFCACDAKIWEAAPNTHVCPVCLGLPGALPVPNERAIKLTQMLGLALNCTVARNSKFDRKNYFYPDLPKGYQISQYDKPLAFHGWLKFEIRNPKLQTNSKSEARNSKRARIRRVHLEEDTAKSIHQEDATLIDFNKSGIPLIEVVTEPDLHSANEAVELSQQIQQLARWFGIAEANMARGQMRVELNISIREIQSSTLPGYKVEVKNINSFRYLKRIIGFEIARQTQLLDRGKIPDQETRGWNERGETVSQRFKETEADYRYFPEPDIPPLKFSREYLGDIEKKVRLHRVPSAIVDELITKDALTPLQAKLIVVDPHQVEYYTRLKTTLRDPRLAAKVMINKQTLVKKYPDPSKLAAFLKKQQATVISDRNEIVSFIDQVIQENPEVVIDYTGGKKPAAQALIGKLMAKTQGRADPQLSQKLLVEKLDALP